MGAAHRASTTRPDAAAIWVGFRAAWDILGLVWEKVLGTTVGSPPRASSMRGGIGNVGGVLSN
ncbi:hypothetical protein [Marivita sp. S6314]|uniref:hypothetical protein n=1 Tax=Marivita sp. S6314 TaxID=2926406 RepID=UPI001FF11EA0|nr:hypothetical protein [Marivita sp. S6314]